MSLAFSELSGRCVARASKRRAALSCLLRTPCHRATDLEQLGELCYEVLREGHEVLVFCPTKQKAEQAAKTIAQVSGAC